MLTGEIARAQIEDRVRAADMARTARMVSSRRVREPRIAVRSVGSGVLAAIVSLTRMVPTTPRARSTTA